MFMEKTGSDVALGRPAWLFWCPLQRRPWGGHRACPQKRCKCRKKGPPCPGQVVENTQETVCRKLGLPDLGANMRRGRNGPVSTPKAVCVRVHFSVCLRVGMCAHVQTGMCTLVCVWRLIAGHLHLNFLARDLSLNLHLTDSARSVVLNLWDETPLCVWGHISDIYMMTHNKSRMTVMKQQQNMVGVATT